MNTYRIHYAEFLAHGFNEDAAHELAQIQVGFERDQRRAS